MKRTTIVAMLTVIPVGYALAADMPQSALPPAFVPVVATVYNWGGIYLGLNGGYAFGSSKWSSGPITSGNFSVTGPAIGGTLGVNIQSDAFVFGVETDLDYSPVKGNASPVFCAACQTSNTWLGTTRARAGYAANRVLFYGTAGGAYGNIKATALGVSNTTTEFGWVAGGGVEAAFTDNWTGRLEYLFVDLKNGSCTSACGSLPATAQSVSFAESLVRAGIDYKFRP
jgi:outer membrane immunogenic protein